MDEKDLTGDVSGRTGKNGMNEKPKPPKTHGEPKRTAKPAPVLREVDSALSSRGLPRWACESIKVFARWKSGKMVSDEQIETAVDGWNKRRQGGGRR